MALTSEEKRRPDMISSDRILTWQEFVEWLRATADRCEKLAKAEETKGLPEDLQEFAPADLWDWFGALT